MSNQNQPIVASAEPKNVDAFIIGPSGVGKRKFVQNFRELVFGLAAPSDQRKTVDIFDKRYQVKTTVHTDVSSIPGLKDPENRQIFILMFDMTRPETLDQAASLWNDLRPRLKYGGANSVRCLVGNKADRSQEPDAPSRRATRVALKQLGCWFFEVSALQARNIEDVFVHLIRLPEIGKHINGQWRIPEGCSVPIMAQPLHTTFTGPTVHSEVRMAIVGEVSELMQARFAQMFTLGLPHGSPIENRGTSPWSTELTLGAHRVTLYVQNAHGDCPTMRERRPGHPGSEWTVDDVDAFIVLLDAGQEQSVWYAQVACRKIIEYKTATRPPDSQAPLPTPMALIAFEPKHPVFRCGVKVDLTLELAKPLGCAFYEIDLATMAAWEVIEGVKKALTMRVVQGRENAKCLVEIPAAKSSHQRPESSHGASWRLPTLFFRSWGRGGDSYATSQATSQANEKTRKL